MATPLSGHDGFLAHRQQMMDQASDPGIKKHYQTEIDLVKSWGSNDIGGADRAGPEGDIGDGRPHTPGGAPSSPSCCCDIPTSAPGGGTKEAKRGVSPAEGGDNMDKGAEPTTGSVPGDGAISTAPQTERNTPEQSQAVSVAYTRQLMKDFDLTAEQASGIVGNLYHESAGLNSGMRQGMTMGQPTMHDNVVNQTGYGIAQWGEERKQGLINYANANGLDPSSQAANYGFMKQELSGEFKSVIDKVKSATSAKEAAEIFSREYEKPADPQMEKRYGLAEQVLAWYRSANA